MIDNYFYMDHYFFFTLLTTLEIVTKVVFLYLLNAIIESNQDNLYDFKSIINRMF